jgi:multiple antibiotic resistance protein
MDIKEIGSAFIVLFAVIDITGSIPLILGIKQKTGVKPLLATMVSLGIMIAFLFLGESILKFLGLDIKSFSVAGSLIMLFLAFEMILGVKLFKDEDATEASVSVVPLAFPIIAGAGTMTAILSIRAEYAVTSIVVAILLNAIPIYTVLRLTGKIERILGPSGMRIVKKVFGIILLAISVKLFSANAKLLFA